MTRGLLDQGHTVFVEPSALLPDAVRQDLESQGAVFRSRSDILNNGIPVYEINL